MPSTNLGRAPPCCWRCRGEPLMSVGPHRPERIGKGRFAAAARGRFDTAGAHARRGTLARSTVRVAAVQRTPGHHDAVAPGPKDRLRLRRVGHAFAALRARRAATRRRIDIQAPRWHGRSAHAERSSPRNRRCQQHSDHACHWQPSLPATRARRHRATPAPPRGSRVSSWQSALPVSHAPAPPAATGYRPMDSVRRSRR